MSTVNAVEEKGPRWWEVQRGPKSEELGARSRSSAKLNSWRKACPSPRSANTLARQRHGNYDRQATVDKKTRFHQRKKLNQLNRSEWRRKRDDVGAVRRRIGGISCALSTKVARRAKRDVDHAHPYDNRQIGEYRHLLPHGRSGSTMYESLLSTR